MTRTSQVIGPRRSASSPSAPGASLRAPRACARAILRGRGLGAAAVAASVHGQGDGGGPGGGGLARGHARSRGRGSQSQSRARPGWSVGFSRRPQALPGVIGPQSRGAGVRWSTPTLPAMGCFCCGKTPCPSHLSAFLCPGPHLEQRPLLSGLPPVAPHWTASTDGPSRPVSVSVRLRRSLPAGVRRR